MTGRSSKSDDLSIFAHRLADRWVTESDASKSEMRIYDILQYELDDFRKADDDGIIDGTAASLKWIESLYILETRSAIDLMFDNIDTMLSDGNFEAADRVIKNIDIDRLNTYLMVALLSITQEGRLRLPSRSRILKQIKNRITLLDPDRAESLVKGFFD